MDATTHFLVPYAAALLVLGAWREGAPAKRVSWALAFGAGGWAPDFDVSVDWLSSRVDALYFLQHRGLSHSLLGAPLFAAVVLGLLGLGARRWRRLARFRWSPGLLVAALLGSLTHLLLDGITYGGVPLLWPFAAGRFTWPLFSWLVWWLFPLGLLVLALHAFTKRVDRRMAMACGAAFVVLLAIVGAVRLAARPDAPEGGMVLPRASAHEWTVLQPAGDGWRASLLDHGVEVANRTYEPIVPPPGAWAIEAARRTDGYKGFQLGLFGPEVVQVRRVLDEGGSGWNVTFLAVAQRFEAEMRPDWTPSRDAAPWGMASFRVGDDGTIRHTVRGW